MEKPIENYWQLRLNSVKEALEANNFEVFIAASTEEAKQIVLEHILPQTEAQSIAWGGSMTLRTTGLIEALTGDASKKLIHTSEPNVPQEEILERRRQALLVDLFLTSTNALTETGELVNLDMIGNRVGAITFGPKHVVLLVGRNKIVPDLEAAMLRIKNYAAPTNAMRLGIKTPCVKTSYCEECESSRRICNVWTITEKSYPKGRIKVVLINQDVGI